MNYHTYSEPKTDPLTGREWHQCLKCGQIDPVDNNTLNNMYCFAPHTTEEKRVKSLFNQRLEKEST